MTEQQLQDAVTGICQLYGIAWFHPYLSKRSVPGWPDLALLGEHGFLVRELKSDTGKASTAQLEWGRLFAHAGISWDVWRPEDLRSGRIQRELQAIKLTARALSATGGDGTLGVGYKLYRQIRDHAPPDWTSGELVVALMIADSANEQTRRAYITAEDLRKLCRMTASGLRKNLEKLGEKGFEFRVQKGRDKHGKALYAVAGNGVEYRVPPVFEDLARASAVAFGLVDKLADGGLSTDRGGTAVPARRDCSPACRVRVPSDLDFKTISKPPQPQLDHLTTSVEPRARETANHLWKTLEWRRQQWKSRNRSRTSSSKPG